MSQNTDISRFWKRRRMGRTRRWMGSRGTRRTNRREKEERKQATRTK